MAAIWDSKKYNRINWQNRPSTATALGATNLNKIDVFCNDVDNALIQMDAGKLNIETANSMLASVSFDSETGKFTFKELDGTTYEYDLNLEKIPVSFTLTEDGILTMTTEDGTQWTCNIADLIKDYVFDDSDTIAFEKEFVEEDDEGKGSYHVTASVKAGSINESHLDPDYRSDILTYKNQALTAANDSLTYSKDSKRWAVGDAEYEGSATDNSKYYKEQAEAAKAAAEQARDEAQAATGAVVMAPGVLGVGKPDNTTIEVASDGTISAKEATSTSPGISRPDGTTLGVEEGVMKMIADATSLLITDNQELVVEKVGDVAQKTTTQLLIDTIAQKVANELVTNSALTTTLANYVTKAMMSNVQVNDQNKVPTSSLAFSMNQAIIELNSDFSSFKSTEIQEIDIDNISQNGFYKISNRPGLLIHICWDTNYIAQLMFPYGASEIAKIRNKCAGTWGDWWDLKSLSNLFTVQPFFGSYIYNGESTQSITVPENRITNSQWRIIAACQDGGAVIYRIRDVVADSFTIDFENAVTITRINYCAFYNG